MKRVLVLEPYYGGSHRSFLRGLREHIRADFHFLTLPARKWKMRMQLSAPWFVEQIRQLPEGERRFDTLLCSTFVDVAVLRALLGTVPGWDPQTLVCTYFHENQFVYPGQVADPSRHQFTSINFTTALTSDRCGFNSRFNLETFLQGSEYYLKKAADMKLTGYTAATRGKSTILYPGMDYSCLDRCCRSAPDREAPVIVWNHRWEHDKGPEPFFQALYQLQEKGIGFRLIVLGQSFASVPSCFAEARQRLAEEIIHFGYVEDKEEYARMLNRGDLVVSTALHEFYGIAVLEAIRAGCFPLLPAALSYPELYENLYLYEQGTLVKRLEDFLTDPSFLDRRSCMELTERFAWTRCAQQYEQWLFRETE